MNQRLEGLRITSAFQLQKTYKMQKKKKNKGLSQES